MDRVSFILGMTTAFAECVVNECKKIAFSPPFYPQDYELVYPEAERIADEQRIYLWHEKNMDIPPANRVHWLVLYKFPDVLDEYRQLRDKGFNPVWDLEKFYPILSYGIVWGKGAANVVPKFRKDRETQCTFSRILLKPGGWPIPKQEGIRTED